MSIAKGIGTPRDSPIAKLMFAEPAVIDFKDFDPQLF